jgi:lipid-A-disaccharide synthase
MKLCVLNFQVRLNEAVEAATLFEPHVVVTVDSKGFSFRFLKRLRGMNSNDHTLLE